MIDYRIHFSIQAIITLLISEYWVYHDVMNMTQLPFSLTHTVYQQHCVVKSKSDSQFWLQVILSFHPELISSLLHQKKKGPDRKLSGKKEEAELETKRKNYNVQTQCWDKSSAMSAAAGLKIFTSHKLANRRERVFVIINALFHHHLTFPGAGGNKSPQFERTWQRFKVALTCYWQ